MPLSKIGYGTKFGPCRSSRKSTCGKCPLHEFRLFPPARLSTSLEVIESDTVKYVIQYVINYNFIQDQARLYQFMRDLIACRDWYDRDSGCILSRDELCDIINFLAASLIDVCFLLLHVSFIFDCLVYFFFIILYYVYDYIIK